MSTADAARAHAQRGVRFFIVGTTAAATHYIVGLAAYTFFGAGPGLANVIGYATGFPVSYGGHRYWTFETTRAPHREALPKFMLVQLSSFAANQTLLLLAVRFVPLPFWFLLGAVLVLVAVSTYLLSKIWVFRT
jgi:putative flippase GtrA